MVEELDNLLKGCLIIPYDKEIVSKFSEVCKLYVQSHNSDNDIAEMALFVFTKQRNDKFKKELEDMYMEQFSIEFNLPQCTLKAFATHIIELILSEENNIGINSLALINCMVVLNQNFKQVPYPKVFSKYMNVFDKYFIEHGILDTTTDDIEILNNIFKMENDELKEVSINDINEYLPSIHSLARDAWYYRIQQYLLSNDVLDIKCIHQRIYVALIHIVESMPWYFINQQFHQMLKLLLPEQEEPVMISEIANIIKNNINNNTNPNHNSSILLRLLQNDEELLRLPFVRTYLTPKEFAIYLYFELMLEKKFK